LRASFLDTRRVRLPERTTSASAASNSAMAAPFSTKSAIRRSRSRARSCAFFKRASFARVGGNLTIRSDVRIVCATNKNLEEEVAKRTFREDLFYRLNVVRIHLPPLRQRVDDITLLAEYFLQKLANRKHRPPLKLSEDAIRVMEAYPWPGNVRELENTMQRATVLATADVLLPKDIPLGLTAPDAGASSIGEGEFPDKDRAIENLFRVAEEDSSLALLPWVEREFTLRAMQKTDNNQVRAGEIGWASRAPLSGSASTGTGAGTEVLKRIPQSPDATDAEPAREKTVSG